MIGLGTLERLVRCSMCRQVSFSTSTEPSLLEQAPKMKPETQRQNNDDNRPARLPVPVEQGIRCLCRALHRLSWRRAVRAMELRERGPR